jgi:probable HAF family extracellular repeat protein
MSDGPSEIKATLWHPDGSLEVLPGYAFPREKAFDINNGNMVGGLSYYEWDRWEAAVWAPDGTITTLGGLWEVTKGCSEIHGVNDAGVAVGISTSDTSLGRAFRWTAETGMVDIGTLGGNEAKAWAINNEGVIVGWSLDETLQVRPFAFDYGRFIELGLLPGGTNGEALAINDNRLIVGGSTCLGGEGENQAPAFHPVMWRIAPPDVARPEPAIPDAVDLGVMFPLAQAYAVAINNRGQVVGNSTSQDIPFDYVCPWIWEDGVMRPLQELIPPGTGWVLERVTDINDHGWITGQDDHSMAKGFVLIPLQDGDLDYDGDVELDDFAAFGGCIAGPGHFVSDTCQAADIDEDGDIDLADFARLTRTFGRP